MKFTVLSIVGSVASGLALTCSSGVLGTIVYLYTLAVSVGSTINPTIHIKFYQERASDCSTYIRESRYYYGAYSEISKTFYEAIKTPMGSLKLTYAYFHSVRPDYSGNSACMKYK